MFIKSLGTLVFKVSKSLFDIEVYWSVDKKNYFVKTYLKNRRSGSYKIVFLFRNNEKDDRWNLTGYQYYILIF